MNSAPVTPEPTTMSSSGSSSRSYTWVQFRIRSPSGCASGSSRGCPPVAISTASAVSVSSVPSADRTITLREPSRACMPSRRARPRSTRAAGAGHGGGDVVRLGEREALHTAVDLAEVDAHHPRGRVDVWSVVGDDDAEFLVRRIEGGHHLGRRDKGLRRHAVGEHRRPAQTVAVDDGHLRAELGGHEGRLVSAGSATDDHDPSHVLHCPARFKVLPPWGAP